MTTAIAPDVVTEQQVEQPPRCETEFVTWKGLLGDPSGITKCENPATWWGRCLHCPAAGLWCDSCKDRAECKGDFRLWLNICADCGGRGQKWRRL